jgi:hypothetical protein
MHFIEDSCLTPTQQFFSYKICQEPDDKVHFVLDQHT